MMRKGILRLMALLLAVMPFFGVSAGTTHAATSRVAVIKEMSGTVQVKKAGGSKQFKAFKKMSLNEGDILSTGAGASAVLQFANGTSEDDQMTVSANATLTFSKLSDRKGTRTKVSMFNGSAWVDVKSIATKNDEFTLETPTAVMGVRGTHFFASVDPVTGTTSMAVAAGIVSTQTLQPPVLPSGQYGSIPNLQISNGGSQVFNAGQFGYIPPIAPPPVMVYPTQQIIVNTQTFPQDLSSKVSVVNVQDVVAKASPEILKKIIQNGPAIVEENDALRQKLLELLDRGVSGDQPDLNSLQITNQDDLNRLKQNLDNLLGAIAKKAVEEKKLSDKNIQDILDQTGQKLDYANAVLQITEEQKKKQEELNRLEQLLRQQMQDQRQRELEQQNQELIKQIEELKKKNEEANKKALEEKKKKAEKDYESQLSDAEKKRFQENKKQLEQEPGTTTGTGTGTGTGGGGSHKSNEASLSSLNVYAMKGTESSSRIPVTLTPVFGSNQLTYSAAVENDVLSLVIVPTATESNAVIKVKGTILASGSESSAIPVTVGANTIDVEVTAQDGTTKKNYQIVVTRSDSSFYGVKVQTLVDDTTYTWEDKLSFSSLTSYDLDVPAYSSFVLVTPSLASGVHIDDIYFSHPDSESLTEGGSDEVIKDESFDGYLVPLAFGDTEVSIHAGEKLYEVSIHRNQYHEALIDWTGKYQDSESEDWQDLDPVGWNYLNYNQFGYAVSPLIQSLRLNFNLADEATTAVVTQSKFTANSADPVAVVPVSKNEGEGSHSLSFEFNVSSDYDLIKVEFRNADGTDIGQPLLLWIADFGSILEDSIVLKDSANTEVAYESTDGQYYAHVSESADTIRIYPKEGTPLLPFMAISSYGENIIALANSGYIEIPLAIGTNEIGILFANPSSVSGYRMEFFQIDRYDMPVGVEEWHLISEDEDTFGISRAANAPAGSSKRYYAEVYGIEGLSLDLTLSAGQTVKLFTADGDEITDLSDIPFVYGQYNRYKLVSGTGESESEAELVIKVGTNYPLNEDEIQFVQPRPSASPENLDTVLTSISGSNDGYAVRTVHSDQPIDLSFSRDVGDIELNALDSGVGINEAGRFTFTGGTGVYDFEIVVRDPADQNILWTHPLTIYYGELPNTLNVPVVEATYGSTTTPMTPVALNKFEIEVPWGTTSVQLNPTLPAGSIIDIAYSYGGYMGFALEQPDSDTVIANGLNFDYLPSSEPYYTLYLVVQDGVHRYTYQFNIKSESVS